jgi:hypothetical protein
MHSLNTQQQNNLHAMDSLLRFQAGLEQAVQSLKITDKQETARVIEETIVMARRNGLAPEVMVGAALAEKMAILDSVAAVVVQIENVAMGTLRWTDIANTNDGLKAIAQSQSPSGKLRQQFEYLPCFIQSKAFYDACQRVVDTIANDGKLYSMDAPSTSRN